MLVIRGNDLSITFGQKMGLRKVFTLALAAIFMFAATTAAAELRSLSIISGSHSPGLEIPMDITEDVIAYDGGPARYYPNYPYNQIGTQFAVRFTPIQACSLTYISIVSYSDPPGISGPAIIHIYDEEQGQPGDDIITPFTATLASDQTRQIINLPSPVDIGENDFHIAVEYSQPPPPFVTLDNDGGTGRSALKLPGQYWETIEENDLNFRAFVIYYDADDVPPTILSEERVLGFSSEGDHPITATVTDESGILSASVYYSTDGIDFLEITMDNTSGDIWVGNIPAQPVGTTVFYYIQAIDNSPYQNEAMLPESGPSDPFTMEIVEGREMAYDDGSAEVFWIVGDVWDDNKIAVRFTPVEYPLLVTGAMVLVDDITDFEFTVNSDSNEEPGEIVAGPFVSFQNISDWAVTFFPDDQRPVITSGDFWLIFHWPEISPESPAAGNDFANPDLRSYWYSTTTGWSLLETGDFIMRVIVTSPTGIRDSVPDGSRPETFALPGKDPNPFNPTTEIIFAAPRSGHVRLEVYNIIGQKVKTLLDETVATGLKAVTWDGRSDRGYPVASGIYYYRLSTVDGNDVKKMTFLK
ncbi:MAG: FlgD immunoglobulin-like domain containing protein [candidate division Zixibacteria bacterium]